MVKVPAVGHRMKYPPIGTLTSIGDPLVCENTKPRGTVLVQVIDTGLTCANGTVAAACRTCIVHALAANNVLLLVHDGLTVVMVALVGSAA